MSLPGIGQRIGPFDLVERLGGGRGTSLFRGVRAAPDREPRVVILRVANRSDDPRATGAVRDEFEVLRSLDDPRIPASYGWYESPGALAMHYAPGITLTDAAQAQRDGLLRIDPSTAIDIVSEIAQALRAAHELPPPAGPVLHGHLGAQRVRLTPEGQVVVTGFGASATGRHTAYTSPETAAGELQDWRADQWSLGAICVELLLGERLYEGQPDPRISCLQGRVAPYLDRVDRAWPAIGKVLRVMLAPERGDRFQSGADLARELLLACQATQGTADRAALVRRVLQVFDRLSATRPPTPSILPPKKDDERAGASAASADDSPSIPPSPVKAEVRENARIIDAVAAREDRQARPAPRPPTAPVGLGPTASVSARPPTPVPPSPPRTAEPTLVPANENSTPRPGQVDLDELLAEAAMGHPLAGPGPRAEDKEEEEGPESPTQSGIQSFQPTELAGFLMGLLLIVVGLAFLAIRLS